MKILPQPLISIERVICSVKVSGPHAVESLPKLAIGLACIMIVSLVVAIQPLLSTIAKFNTYRLSFVKCYLEK